MVCESLVDETYVVLEIRWFLNLRIKQVFKKIFCLKTSKESPTTVNTKFLKDGRVDLAANMFLLPVVVLLIGCELI